MPHYRTSVTLEALADAIIAYTNYSNPESLQYKFRNPLGLKMYCSHAQWFKQCNTCSEAGPVGARHKYDRESGMRMFSGHVHGYDAALFDLYLKCRGESRSKVTKDSSIRELIRSYYLPDGTSSYVVRFLRRALKDESITEATPVNYFVNEKDTCHQEMTSPTLIS